MADLRKLRFDPKKAVDGVWVDWYDAKLLVARASNKRFRDRYAKLSEPHLKELREKTADESLSTRILKQAIAETILLGWDGITEGDQPVPYSPEKALELFNDPGLDLYEFVTLVSNGNARYAAEAAAAAEKN